MREGIDCFDPKQNELVFLDQAYLKINNQKCCCYYLLFQSAIQSYKAGVPKLSLAMYPFSISIDEHVPLKFHMTKTGEENKRNIFTNKHNDL